MPALIGAFVLLGINSKQEKAIVEIYVAGELKHNVPLSSGQTDFFIYAGEDGYNIVRIQEDGVYIAEANCYSQTCVLSGKYSRPGQVIACLPHRVLVKLTGQSEGGIDAIAY